MLLRNEPNPGREVTSRPEGPGVSNTRDQSGRQHRTDPGNVMKALARLAGPVPRHDHPIELHNLLLEAEELSTERGKARTGNLRHPLVASGRQRYAAVPRHLYARPARECPTRRGP